MRKKVRYISTYACLLVPEIPEVTTTSNICRHVNKNKSFNLKYLIKYYLYLLIYVQKVNKGLSTYMKSSL